MILVILKIILIINIEHVYSVIFRLVTSNKDLFIYPQLLIKDIVAVFAE